METTTHNQTPVWTLGDRLAKARRFANIGSSGMASQLNVSRTTISNYESGRTEPSIRILRRWSEVTGVPIDWFLDYQDERDPRSRCFLSDGHEVHYPTLPFAA